MTAEFLACTECFLKFCAAAAVLELDNLRYGQLQLSRPIVAGPLLGWIAGDPGTGALMGLAIEVLTIDALPMGALVPLSGTIATAGAVWAGAASEFTGAPQGGSAGAALAGGLALGAAFRFVEIGLRSVFNRANAQLESDWRRGEVPGPWKMLSTATLTHLCWAFVATLAGGKALQAFALRAADMSVGYGFDMAFSFVTILGVVAFLAALRPRPA